MSGDFKKHIPIKFEKFSSMLSFGSGKNSFFQCLAYSIIGTKIRFTSRPMYTKRFSNNLSEEFERAEKFCNKNNQFLPFLPHLDAFKQIYFESTKVDLQYRYLDHYAGSQNGGLALDYGMRVVICSLLGTYCEEQLKVINGNNLQNLNELQLLGLVSERLGLGIHVYTPEGEVTKCSQISYGDYPIIYLLKEYNRYSILYTAEAIELEIDPKNSDLLRHENILHVHNKLNLIEAGPSGKPQPPPGNYQPPRIPQALQEFPEIPPKIPQVPPEMTQVLPGMSQVLPKVPQVPGMPQKPLEIPKGSPLIPQAPSGIPQVSPAMSKPPPGLPQIASKFPEPSNRLSQASPAILQGPALEARLDKKLQSWITNLNKLNIEILLRTKETIKLIENSCNSIINRINTMISHYSKISTQTDFQISQISEVNEIISSQLKIDIFSLDGLNNLILETYSQELYYFTKDPAVPQIKPSGSSDLPKYPISGTTKVNNSDPPKPIPPARPKEMKICSECIQEKEIEEFESITCGLEFNCKICDLCRKKNQDQCPTCLRFYSDYEKLVLSLNYYRTY